MYRNRNTFIKEAVNLIVVPCSLRLCPRRMNFNMEMGQKYIITVSPNTTNLSNLVSRLDGAYFGEGTSHMHKKKQSVSASFFNSDRTKITWGGINNFA